MLSVPRCLLIMINWVKCVGALLPDAYEPDVIPEVGEFDELETFSRERSTHKPTF